MQPDGPEIPVAAAQPRLDDEVEADLVEGLAAQSVVEAAQRDCRLVRVARKVSVEQALADGRFKSTPFGPGGHCACFLAADQRGVGKDRRAFG